MEKKLYGKQFVIIRKLFVNSVIMKRSVRCLNHFKGEKSEYIFLMT